MFHTTLPRLVPRIDEDLSTCETEDTHIHTYIPNDGY